MREILFRGKGIDGKWVEGYLEYFTLESGRMCSYISKWGERICIVNSETVGQYTGLTDKNGVKIFEGDMLKPFDDEFDKMVVEFHGGGFMLCIYGERGYMGESGAWISEGNYGLIECELLSSYGDDIEVIGNIYDDSKILER